MSDVECRALGPDGARCAKTRTHKGDHGGITRYGNWTAWN